ncbi:MAG: sugar ABC transporter permease, partial [Anaerolineaceae bacterium]|nr:sugar ABC transporter permease [Anaerolineaceae bacterium]
FRKYGVAYAFIAVPVISMLLFIFIPMAISFYWSLCDFSGIQAPRFIGLDNYIKLFTVDKIFIQALKNTLLFVVLSMFIGPTLGLLTALMLNQKVKFQGLFRTAYFLPVMTSMVVVSTIWKMLYNQNGIFNTVLTNIGLSPVNWLSDPNKALISVVIASVWQGFGFETVIFLAALQSIPKELYEAADIDGANGINKFFNVTLPSLRSVITFVYIYGLIGSFQTFDQMYVMTKGGPVYRTTTIVLYLFDKFQDLRLGYASAIAYVLFFILVILSFIQWRLPGSKSTEA